LGIQIADLAAGLFGRVAQILVSRASLPVELREIVDAWRETVNDSGVHYWMVSDAKLPRILTAVLGNEEF
jgi:hypothetical protein